MTLSGKNIGFAVTGSFCTISEAIIELERLAFLGVEVYPILSTAVATTNTGLAGLMILEGVLRWSPARIVLTP